MKFSVYFFLVLFLTFLSTPTIVSFVEKDCDTSIFYTMTEEEETHKDLKVFFANLSSLPSSGIPVLQDGQILSENLSRHDNVFSSIFSPPPEQV